MPLGRVKILATALMKTWNSPEFRKDAKRARLDVNPIDGPTITKLLVDLYSTPKPLVKEIIATTKKKRKKKKKS